MKPGVTMVKRVKEAMKREEQQKETNTKNRQKTYKEQEKESREAALQNSITNQNKGFALLQKMGYRAGQGLGKQGRLFFFSDSKIFQLLLYLLLLVLIRISSPLKEQEELTQSH